MKYKITIEEITEVEEVCQTWRDPETDKDYTSRYNIEDEEIKDRLKVSERCTGKIIIDETLVYKQTVDGLKLDELVIFINKK